MRSDAPAQCVVVPPTVLQIHVGRPEKSLATRHEPDVVRLSSQASWPKEAHSSLMNVAGDSRLPASSSTTFTPCLHNPFASVPPPAPEPITTMTESSPCEYVVMMFSARVGSSSKSGRAGLGGWRRQPLEIVESSQQVTSALLECVALVSEMCEGEFVVVERYDRLAANFLEEGSLRERRGDLGLLVLGRSGEVATGGLVESGRPFGEPLLHICAAGGFRIEG